MKVATRAPGSARPLMRTRRRRGDGPGVGSRHDGIREALVRVPVMAQPGAARPPPRCASRPDAGPLFPPGNPQLNQTWPTLHDGAGSRSSQRGRLPLTAVGRRPTSTNARRSPFDEQGHEGPRVELGCQRQLIIKLDDSPPVGCVRSGYGRHDAMDVRRQSASATHGEATQRDVLARHPVGNNPEPVPALRGGARMMGAKKFRGRSPASGPPRFWPPPNPRMGTQNVDPPIFHRPDGLHPCCSV